MSVFGDKPFKEIMNLKLLSMGGFQLTLIDVVMTIKKFRHKEVPRSIAYFSIPMIKHHSQKQFTKANK